MGGGALSRRRVSVQVALHVCPAAPPARLLGAFLPVLQTPIDSALRREWLHILFVPAVC